MKIVVAMLALTGLLVGAIWWIWRSVKNTFNRIGAFLACFATAGRCLLPAACCLLAFPALAVAADAATGSGLSLSSLWQGLIPVAVPLLIVVLKFVVPMVPGWLLPIIAPVLGGLADAVIAYVAGGTANPVLGAILGSAGVGIREVVDQLKKAGSG